MSDEKSKMNFIDFLSKNSKKIITVLASLAVFAVIAFGGFFVYNGITPTNNDPDVLATVGNEKIYKSDVSRKAYAIGLTGDLSDNNLASAKGLDKDWEKDALENLISESGAKQIAVKEGITVSDKEIQAELEKLEDYKNYTPEQISVLTVEKRASLYTEKLREKVLTKKSGRYIKVRFDKHMQIDPTLPAAEIAAREASQASDIKADKEYADNLKDSLYTKLKDGSLTFDQAMEQVRGDKFIDWQNWDFTIGDPSVTFDTANSPVGFKIMNSDILTQRIESTKKGELSEPFVTELDFAKDGEPVQKKEAMWILLTVDGEHAGRTTDFAEWLRTETDKLGVSSSTRASSFINNFAASVYAYNPFECSNGRTGDSSSVPADVILEARYRSESASSSSAANDTYTYIRPSQNAYSYSGCPIPNGSGSEEVTVDYVAGDGGSHDYYRSEESNSNGCMYKFSSVSSSPINQCCGDSHNNHVIWFNANQEFAEGTYNRTHGKWDFFHGARSDGSSYNTNNEEFDDESYGTVNSGRIVREVYNGETLYLRGYWIIQDNHAPTISATAPATNTEYYTTDSVSLTATTTDSDTVHSQDKVNQKAMLYYSSDGGTNWGSPVTYTTGDQAPGLRTIHTFAANTLTAGKYKWVVSAEDWHNLKNAKPSGSIDEWSHNNPFYFTALGPTTATLNVSANPTAGGTVNIDGANPRISTKAYTTTSAAQSYTAQATANAGYTFSAWSSTDCASGSFVKQATNTKNCTATFTSNVAVNNPLTATLVTPAASIAGNTSTYITTPRVGGNASIALVASATDADAAETKNLTISWQTAGSSTWTTSTPTFTSTTSPLPGTFNVSLPAGDYWWQAQAWTSNSADGTVNVPARFLRVVDPVVVVPPALTCSVEPQSGATPFVTRVTITPSGIPLPTTPYSINFGNTVIETTSSTTHYYTYPAAGTYSVTVTSANGISATCNPASLKVYDPNATDGGMVKPN